jgi:SAM-dependent methyltransferase
VRFGTRNCPACGAGYETSKPLIASTTTAESLEFATLCEYWRGFRSDSVHFTYVRCERCSQVFCPTYFSPAQLDELYSFMPDNTNGELLSTLVRTQLQYVRQIRSYGYSGGRILDIGADIGLLIQEIAQNLDTQSDAVEPNTGVHGALSQVVGDGGIIATSLSDLPNGATYDLIAGVHVLDHIVNLRETIERVASKVKKGGHIYFVTHNERSLLRRLLGRRWPPFCLQHPHLFDRRTLAAAFVRAGFTNVQISPTTNYFSLRHIARVGCQLLGLPQKISRLVPPLVIPMRLGNIAVQATWPG